MSESSLSLDYNELRIRIADFLGYGVTSTQWDTHQVLRINYALKDGLANFYRAYDWSFLKPGTTLTTHSLGSWTASTAYTLNQYIKPATYNRRAFLCTGAGTSGASEPTWNTTIGGSTSDGTATWQTVNLYYSLPDDFSSLANKTMTYINETTIDSIIEQRPEPMVLNEIERSISSSGKPRYFAIRPRDKVAGSGTRYEVLFWPEPDAAYTIFYRYKVLANIPTASDKYPHGANQHSQTIVASCLAAAEMNTKDDGSNVWQLKYLELLETSKREDAMNSPHILGSTNPYSHETHNRYTRGDYVYVNGVLYDGLD